MNIRTAQPGDEAAQVAIYNEAAAALQKFKPAAVQDVSRRTAAATFDPSLCFYALEGNAPVAYVQANPNGRISYPWCKKGHEGFAEPLFKHVLAALAKRGISKVFAAYRDDWQDVLVFFRQQGFLPIREMVNFSLDVVETPTIPARPHTGITPLERKDVPALYSLAPHVVRSASAEEFERQLFDNPWFPASSVFVVRSRPSEPPVGAGLLIRNPAYADPTALDASMPCFRLGAFGAEGMQTKRINGMFGLLCRDDSRCGGIAVDLLGHALRLLTDSDNISTLAAQVPSDARHWLRFYQMTWHRQGSFPVLERRLAS